MIHGLVEQYSENSCSIGMNPKSKCNKLADNDIGRCQIQAIRLCFVPKFLSLTDSQELPKSRLGQYWIVRPGE